MSVIKRPLPENREINHRLNHTEPKKNLKNLMVAEKSIKFKMLKRFIKCEMQAVLHSRVLKEEKKPINFQGRFNFAKHLEPTLFM